MVAADKPPAMINSLPAKPTAWALALTPLLLDEPSRCHELVAVTQRAMRLAVKPPIDENEPPTKRSPPAGVKAQT